MFHLLSQARLCASSFLLSWTSLFYFSALLGVFMEWPCVSQMTTTVRRITMKSWLCPLLLPFCLSFYGSLAFFSASGFAFMAGPLDSEATWTRRGQNPMMASRTKAKFPSRKWMKHFCSLDSVSQWVEFSADMNKSAIFDQCSVKSISNRNKFLIYKARWMVSLRLSILTCLRNISERMKSDWETAKKKTNGKK